MVNVIEIICTNGLPEHNMAHRPEITIGICVKNAQGTIRETIYSVITQDYCLRKVEIVVVDGDSTDATLSIIRHMIANRDIPLRIYSDKGKGLGYARQIVVMQAKAKYVIFVDGDVVLRRDFFRNQLEFMDRNPQVAVGLGRYLFKAGNLISTTWNLYQSTMNEFVGCAFIVRTDATRMVRGFDENIKGASEDIDLILRLQAEGWSTAVIESAGFYHNYRSSLKAFWREHQWFGYGDHYLLRKYVHRLPVWRNSPAAQLLQGLRMAAKAYRAKKCKVSFLIPVFLMIGNMAWWSGYLKAVWHGISHDA